MDCKPTTHAGTDDLSRPGPKPVGDTFMLPKRIGRGGSQVYSWDAWADGQVHEFDFSGADDPAAEVQRFRSGAYQYAAKYGMTVETRTDPGGTRVQFQFLRAGQSKPKDAER